jgi:pyrroloquinoline quinone (PQQ) biosynthesis protein C
MQNTKVNMYEHSEDVIPVSITLPKKVFDHLAAKTFEEAQIKSKQLLPIIERLAYAAFSKKDKPSWDAVQNLLYYFNHNDITRKNRLHNFTWMVESVLRQAILDQEIRAMAPVNLECEDQFSAEAAVEEMAKKANAHRINHHPLLTHMAEKGLSQNEILHFISNYYVNNRLFHLFIVTLSLFTPLEGRTELANNFFDELGAGDTAMAHPKLFLKNFDTVGRPTEIIPLAEALHLANAKTHAAYLSGDYHYGMGGFGFIELTMPEQMKKILAGLGKSNVPKKDLEFWDMHISIDLEHGKTWFREMLSLVQTPEQAKKCLQGGMILLEARATMYDGIWNAIQSERQ